MNERTKDKIGAALLMTETRFCDLVRPTDTASFGCERTHNANNFRGNTTIQIDIYLDSADPGFFLELIKELIGHEENHDAKEESVNDDEEGDESRAVVIIAIENVDVWS